jgi:putative hemolysin
MKSKTKKEILEDYETALEQKNKMKWMVGQVRYDLFYSKLEASEKKKILAKIDQLLAM